MESIFASNDRSSVNPLPERHAGLRSPSLQADSRNSAISKRRSTQGLSPNFQESIFASTAPSSWPRKPLPKRVFALSQESFSRSAPWSSSTRTTITSQRSPAVPPTGESS